MSITAIAHAVLPRAEKIERRELLVALPYAAYESARRLVAAHAGSIVAEEFAADVTLQVDTASAGHGAEERAVERDDVADVVWIVGELLEAIVGRGGMGGRPFVPHRPVDLDVCLPFGHHGTIAGHGAPPSSAHIACWP